MTINKFQKQDMRNKIHIKIHTLKKKLKRAKFKKDIKTINVSINKLQRQLKKLN